MLKRILTAGIGLVIMLPFVIFSDTFMLLIFTAVLSAVGVYEMLKCIGKQKELILTVACEAVTISVQILARTVEDDTEYLGCLFLICAVFCTVMLASAVFSHGRISIADSATLSAMTVYIAFGFSSLILLRDMKYGFVLFVLWFAIPWICDAMAYFTGMRFGKHKLIPDVSPKKTIEGAVGGILGTMVIILIFGVVSKFGFGMQPNYVGLIVVTVVGCLVSQCGDLIASLIKREHGVKDYGKVFPGHGGVMDRFDSCIATGPFIYLVCVLFSSNALFF